MTILSTAIKLKAFPIMLWCESPAAVDTDLFILQPIIKSLHLCLWLYMSSTSLLFCPLKHNFLFSRSVAARLSSFSQSCPIWRCKTFGSDTPFVQFLYCLCPRCATHPRALCICDQPGDSVTQHCFYFKVTLNIIIQQFGFFFI